MVRKKYNLPEALEPKFLTISEFPSSPKDGSFWITLSENNLLFDYGLELITTSETTKYETNPTSIFDLIQYNLNREIEIIVENIESTQLETWNITPLSINSYKLVLKHNNVTKFIDVSRIKSVNGQDLNYSKQIERNNQTSKKSIKISYVGKGG